jgi:acid phosphatase
VRKVLAAVVAAAALVAIGVGSGPAFGDTPTPLPTLPPTPQLGGKAITLTPQEKAGAASTKHLVVLWMQNNSFDKLFGTWGQVNGDQVDGIAQATPDRTTQVNQDGKPFSCLMFNDYNLLQSPNGRCRDSSGVLNANYPAFASSFTNKPFNVGAQLPSGAQTCPLPGIYAPNGLPANGSGTTAGGCTRDLVHRFYQEQYQLNGGKQNRYVVGSDAIGLSMGYYDTKNLSVYKYLTSAGAPKFAVADRFFAGAFGGSFANGMFLVSATLPMWSGAPASLRSVLDANGMPVTQKPATPTNPGNYNLYKSPNPTGLVDGAQTAACNNVPAGYLCGDYMVNTTQPANWPYDPTSKPANRLPLLTEPNIGDKLNSAGVDWAWYSGGWANADGHPDMPGWSNGSGPTTKTFVSNGALVTNTQACPDPTANPSTTWPLCPDQIFQYHHQNFNYYYNFSNATAATTAMRNAHLRDLQEFYNLTGSGASGSGSCALKPVSFVQELGEGNQHPGYASAYVGDEQIATVLRSIYSGPCAKDTTVVLTYDEFGGAWDHVPPPGQGTATKGAHDQMGPGTRLPTLIVSNTLPRSGVDHTVYDTASILSAIEGKWGLTSLNYRDGNQKPIWGAWQALATKPSKPA